MLAFTRKPPPEEIPPERVELLLGDSDDDLVPLAQPSGRANDIEPEPEPARTTGPASEAGGRAAIELRRFAAADEPLLGWRHALFVVSGIRLRPSRAERALRASVLLVLDSVDPLTPDPAKEASS